MKLIIVAKYTAELIPRSRMPLQIRFKPNNIIEYHLDPYNDAVKDKKQLLIDIVAKWFEGFKVIEEREEET